MKALELTYKLCAPPIFYQIAKSLEQNEINLYGLSTQLKNVEYWVKTEQELSRNNLGMDYVFVQERSMDNVRKYISEFTRDVLIQKLLESLHVGLYEITEEYIGQLRMREKIPC